MAISITLRLKEYTKPLFIITIAIACGFLTLLELAFRELRPLDILHFSKWQDRMFAKFWNFWGPISAKRDAPSVEEVCKEAYGVVIDVGPGNGQTLKYLDKSKITRVFGIEPNLLLHDALRSEIIKQNLEDIYTIIGLGLESLPIPNIEPDSIDSIVSIKALCAIPDPEKVLPTAYALLKPGGQFLVYEHVKSKDAITSRVQNIYQLAWPTLFGGCSINRDTEALLTNAGEWGKVELDKRKGEVGLEIIPHLVGRLVK